MTKNDEAKTTTDTGNPCGSGVMHCYVKFHNILNKLPTKNGKPLLLNINGKIYGGIYLDDSEVGIAKGFRWKISFPDSFLTNNVNSWAYWPAA